ncbi:hypothetical protein E2I00_004967, partial [Balaenoptera physalus]
IYCRGCSKPLCCSCALLDTGHSELKCDIGTEIQQRQEELDVMTQDLQKQDRAFGAAQAEMSSAISQLGRMRADTEEMIQTHVRQAVEHVLEVERQMLEGVNARYQRNYEEIAGQLGRLDAVLQRIRMGSVLVQRMKLYASDQEVLDMHGFLRKALHQLRQEEPQSLRAAVRTDSFDEFKMQLFPGEPAQKLPAHPETLLTLTWSEGEVVCPAGQVSNTATPQKRKSCQTECPRKVIKMESEEEKESRLARSSPEQPRPSTSKAVSPPHLDRAPSPKSPERVVVISSSEDSDAENSVSGSEVRPRTPASPHSRSQGAQPQQVTLRLALRLGNLPPRHKLPSLMPSVPDSLPLTRSKLPSTVGSTSYHAEHKETRAFATSYACPSECIVPPCGLVLPPKGRLMPLLGGGSGEAEHPRLSEQESPLGTLAEPPWRIPKSRSHWKSLQKHSHHPTLQRGLPPARAPRRQASESPKCLPPLQP